MVNGPIVANCNFQPAVSFGYPGPALAFYNGYFFITSINGGGNLNNVVSFQLNDGITDLFNNAGTILLMKSYGIAIN